MIMLSHGPSLVGPPDAPARIRALLRQRRRVERAEAEVARAAVDIEAARAKAKKAAYAAERFFRTMSRVYADPVAAIAVFRAHGEVHTLAAAGARLRSAPDLFGVLQTRPLLVGAAERDAEARIYAHAVARLRAQRQALHALCATGQ